MPSTYLFLARVTRLTQSAIYDAASHFKRGLPLEVVALNYARISKQDKMVDKPLSLVNAIYFGLVLMGGYGVHKGTASFLMRPLNRILSHIVTQQSLCCAYLFTKIHGLQYILKLLPHMVGLEASKEKEICFTSKKEWNNLPYTNFLPFQPGKYYIANHNHAFALVVTEEREVFLFDINTGLIRVNNLKDFEWAMAPLFEEGTKQIKAVKMEAKFPLPLRSKL